MTLVACQSKSSAGNSNQANQKLVEVIPEPPKKVDLKELLNTFTLDDYLENKPYLSEIVDSIYNGLSQEERVGQMLMPAIGKLGKPNAEVTKLVQDGAVGGVLLLGNVSGGYGNTIKQYKQIAHTANRLPLLFSCDAEPSLINQRIKGIPAFPKTATIKTASQAKEIAKGISEVLNSVGVNYNFAPVYDLSANCSVINNRSFGANLSTVVPLANAFTTESQAQNVLATAKHFPGHGLVKGDSHKQLVYIDGELDELPLFEEAIKNGALSVMIGHIAIQNNPTYETGGLPATISPKIVTTLLREQMGFKGLIITDAMNMKAVSVLKQADLRALLAGNDIVLMPANEVNLIKQAVEILATDPAFAKRVEASVKRILRMKVCLGLFS